MPRILVGDLKTGRRILNLPVKGGSFSRKIMTADSISVSVNMLDRDAQKLNLRNAAAAAKSFLAVVEDDVILAAGPIWGHSYSRKDFTLQLDARGIMSMFDHRLILPAIAANYDVTKWTIPDPSDNSRTIANPALASTYSGVSLGTIAKRLVEQAMAWTGGALPIVLPAEEADGNPDHTRTYNAVDFKPVKEALTQLQGVVGGPEIDFFPRFTADKLGIEWVMRVGTVAQPLLTSPSVPRWGVTAAASPVTDFAVDSDASGMGSVSWGQGGRQNDRVLISRASNTALTDAGYPLMEILDTSHTSVSVQSTLDGYTAQNLRDGQRPIEAWSFSVRAHPVDRYGNVAGPQLGSYNVGDFCELTFAAFDPGDDVTGRPMAGDPYLTAKQTFRRRIVSLGGTIGKESIKIQCAPEVAA